MSSKIGNLTLEKAIQLLKVRGNWRITANLILFVYKHYKIRSEGTKIITPLAQTIKALEKPGYYIRQNIELAQGIKKYPFLTKLPNRLIAAKLLKNFGHDKNMLKEEFKKVYVDRRQNKTN